MFLKNKNIIFKIRRSKVTDYAALNNGHAIHTCMLNTDVYIPVCHNPRSQLPHEYIWAIFRVLSTRIIPAAGNRESCLGPVFRPFSNSH